jgi:mannose-6-phosphate isomerase
MEKVFPKTYSGILNVLKSKPNSEGLKRFFSELLTMDPHKQNEIALEALHLAEKHAEDDVAFQWVVRLAREYPGDVGILSPVMLNYVLLEPGEALFLAAGELHSYLSGLVVELMANSDNVIRGGLTPKYIDVSELLRVVEFKPEYPKKIDPVKAGTCEIYYPTPAREFLLSVISIDKDTIFTSPTSRSIEILICLEGHGNIKDLGTGGTLELKRGASAAIPSAVAFYEIKGTGKFYKASIP